MSIFLTLYLALVLAVGTFGNILIIVAVYVNTKLQTTANYLLINLAVSEIFRLLVATPLRLVYVLDRHNVPCLSVILVDTFAHGLPNWNLVLIALDRFVAVTKSLSYKRVMRLWLVRLVVLSVWLVMLCVAILPLTGWGKIAKADHHLQAAVNPPCEPAIRLHMHYVIFECVIIDVLPFLAILLIYSQVLVAVHGQVTRQRKREGSIKDGPHKIHHRNRGLASSRGKTCATDPRYLSPGHFNVELLSVSRVPAYSDNCTFGPVSEQDVSRMTTTRSDSSRIKREKADAGKLKCVKATRNVSCIIFFFALLCFPTTLSHLWSLVFPRHDLPDVLVEVFHALRSFNACVNVFIYGWCNRTFRKTFYSVFRTWRELLSCRN